jgi:hypothetical protein
VRPIPIRIFLWTMASVSFRWQGKHQAVLVDAVEHLADVNEFFFAGDIGKKHFCKAAGFKIGKGLLRAQGLYSLNI